MKIHEFCACRSGCGHLLIEPVSLFFWKRDIGAPVLTVFLFSVYLSIDSHKMPLSMLLTSLLQTIGNALSSRRPNDVRSGRIWPLNGGWPIRVLKGC